MTLVITLYPEMETRFCVDAADAGLTPEELAERRLWEAELLWRIHTAAPENETRRLHKLLRRREAGTINSDEATELQILLDKREERAAQRMEDLAKLSLLRIIPVPDLMQRFALRPR